MIAPTICGSLDPFAEARKLVVRIGY